MSSKTKDRAGRLCPAIVLHRTPWSETSWILRLLTPEWGIVTCTAKGARRAGSPLAGRVDPHSLIEARISWQDGREIQTLSGSELLERHSGLERSPHAMALLQSWSEWLLRLELGPSESTQAFELFRRALDYLHRDPLAGLRSEGLLTLRFLAWVAQWLGIGLQTEACSSCGTALIQGEIGAFRSDTGSFRCSHCCLDRADPVAGALWSALAPRPLQESAWAAAEESLICYLCEHVPQTRPFMARGVLLGLRTLSQELPYAHTHTLP